MKKIVKAVAAKLGLEIRKMPRTPAPNLPTDIRGSSLYRPLFSPWFSVEFLKYYTIAAPRTVVSPDRCYVIHTLLMQALEIEGDIVECGVYRGGTAAMIAKVLAEQGSLKKLYLFDSFMGMPETDNERDYFIKGDFADTSAEEVEKFVNQPGIAIIKKGFIPETFAGLEARRFAFVHIDVDIYQAILDSLEFMWPRLSSGGFVVFDDYGFASCPGAREAVDLFFKGTKFYPLCLPTGQAIVFKH